MHQIRARYYEIFALPWTPGCFIHSPIRAPPSR